MYCKLGALLVHLQIALPMRFDCRRDMELGRNVHLDRVCRGVEDADIVAMVLRVLCDFLALVLEACIFTVKEEFGAGAFFLAGFERWTGIGLKRELGKGYADGGRCWWC